MKDLVIEVERIKDISSLQNFTTSKNFVTFNRSTTSLNSKQKSTQAPVEIPTTAYMGKAR